MLSVDPRNLALKFGQYWVNNCWDIFVFVVGVALVDPSNLPFKFGQNEVSDRWNIVVIVFIVVVIVHVAVVIDC